MEYKRGTIQVMDVRMYIIMEDGTKVEFEIENFRPANGPKYHPPREGDEVRFTLRKTWDVGYTKMTPRAGEWWYTYRKDR